jgi:uncharacterized membrane protein
MSEHGSRGARLASAVLAAALTGGSSLATPPVTLTAVPLPPGMGENRALGISPDGTTVVGWASPIAGNERALRWVIGQTPEVIGPTPLPRSFTTAEAASFNGSFVTGRTGADSYRWFQDGTIDDIPPLAGSLRSNDATGISYDGGVVVGNCQTPDGPRGYRWTPAGGSTPIPLPDPQPNSNEGRASAVSADGTHIAGFSRSATGYHGYLWSTTAGFERTSLGLPGGQGSYARDISADGTVVVGRTEYSANLMRGWVWSAATGYTILPNLPERDTLSPNAISGDGTTVVGSIYPSSDFSDPIVWTSQTGTLRIRDILTSNGVDLTGWTLGIATDVSFDGTSIVGVGEYAGQSRGWLVTIPAPAGTIAFVAYLGLLGAPRRRATWTTAARTRS